MSVAKATVCTWRLKQYDWPIVFQMWLQQHGYLAVCKKGAGHTASFPISQISIQNDQSAQSHLLVAEDDATLWTHTVHKMSFVVELNNNNYDNHFLK